MAEIRIENPNNLPLIKVKDIQQIQGSLVIRSAEDIDKLYSQMLSEGFKFPVFLWFPSENERIETKKGVVEISADVPYSIDGNGRYTTLLAKGKGELEIPYIEIKAKNYKNAKKLIGLAKSQYGKMNQNFALDFWGDQDMSAFSFKDLFLGHNPSGKEKEDPALYEINKNYLEGYTAFIIICDNDTDEEFIRNKIGMENVRSFKKNKIGKTNVIEASKLIAAFNENSNPIEGQG